MGERWDYSGISTNRARSVNTLSDQGRLSSRAAHLEAELRKTQGILHQVIAILERQVGQDVDGDGRIA